MADRYTYVPYIGLGWMVSWGLADLASFGPLPRKLAITAAIAGLAACLMVTAMQVKYWQNSLTLNEHALEVTRGIILRITTWAECWGAGPPGRSYNPFRKGGGNQAGLRGCII